MAISFDDLKLLAITKVKACPAQVITQRLQWAARRFINRSEVWHHDQNRDVIADESDYALSLPTANSEIKRLYGVWYGAEAVQKKAESRVDTDEYRLFLSQPAYVVGDAAAPSTPTPDVQGNYFDTGLMYNDDILYRTGWESTAYYLWFNDPQWRISVEAGDSTAYFEGAGGTIVGDYTAGGTATGAVGATDATGPTVSFYDPYRAALQYGLETELVVIPDLAFTSEIPGEIMDEWGVRGILEMALWDLKNDEDQPWEDSDGAKRHKGMCDRALGEARRQTFIKRKQGDLRVRARYYA